MNCRNCADTGCRQCTPVHELLRRGEVPPDLTGVVAQAWLDRLSLMAVSTTCTFEPKDARELHGLLSSLWEGVP